MVGIWFKKNLSLLGAETAARHPTILQIDLKTPQNVSLLDSDNPTTFPQRTGLTFFRGENDLDELRDFMLSAEDIHSHRSPTADVRSMISLAFPAFCPCFFTKRDL